MWKVPGVSMAWRTWSDRLTTRSAGMALDAGWRIEVLLENGQLVTVRAKGSPQ